MNGHRPHAPRRRLRTGPIVGWRVWCVASERGSLRLRSAVFDDTWRPGTPLVARCQHDHAAPSPECACGIYAVANRAVALRYLVGRDDPDVVHRVLGEVALWGIVVEGERGWRAECAYPARLVVPAAQPDGSRGSVDDVAEALTAYGVEVAIADRRVLV